MGTFHKVALWLSFQLDGIDFCILNDYVDAISIGSIERMPENNKRVAGVMVYGGTVINVLEMRSIFGRVDLKTYIKQFGIMKEMHIGWVEALEKFIREGSNFDKELDPHKCKFGMWFDNYYTDDKRLNRILKKLVPPHERIHHCGAEIVALRASGNDQNEEIEKKLEEVKQICYTDIVPLLDKLIDIYSTINRGVVIVVHCGTHQVGLFVDNVRLLIPFENTTTQNFGDEVGDIDFIRQIVINGKQLLYEINIEELLSAW